MHELDRDDACNAVQIAWRPIGFAATRGCLVPWRFAGDRLTDHLFHGGGPREHDANEFAMRPADATRESDYPGPGNLIDNGNADESARIIVITQIAEKIA